MLTFTNEAEAQLKKITEGADPNGTGIRILMPEEGPPEVSLADLANLATGEEPLRDKITHFFVEFESFMVIVDAKGQKDLGEATLNYAGGGLLSGSFEVQIKEPLPSGVLSGLDPSNPLVQQVQELLEKEINPGLAMHGGRAELLNVLNDKVYLRFGGGCKGCSMIDTTVKQGIENRIREVIPQISGVVDETDHASGENPYYQ